MRRLWCALVLLLAAGLGLALGWALLTLPPFEHPLPGLVASRLAESGVSHPVTAVLLNFRGYDTLLEVAVLLLALLGVLSQTGMDAPARPPGRHAVLVLEARMLVPLTLMVGGYLLWAGASRPGGAFQAGALLAAAAVLLQLAGLLPGHAFDGWRVRSGLVLGPLLFLVLAAVWMPAGRMLQFPPSWAGWLILVIECGLTLSLGLILAGLFLSLWRIGAGRDGGPT